MRPSMRRFYSMRRRFKTAKSSSKRAAHSLDYALLRRFIEIGVHGKADDIAREPFADRQAAFGDRKTAVGGLLMHRFGVIDRGRNALRLQRRGKAVAIDAVRQPDRVLRPDRG